jgi:hypothetical protein
LNNLSAAYQAQGEYQVALELLELEVQLYSQRQEAESSGYISQGEPGVLNLV